MRTSMIRRHTLLALLFVPAILGGALSLYAQDQAFDVEAHYVKSEYMVPMRDGVRLFTIVYTPRDTTQTYPFLLLRTPYSIPPYEPDVYRKKLGPSAEFDRDGYIFVYQDVRGKFRSEGQFEVMQPHKKVKRGSSDIDESSDSYDTTRCLPLPDLERDNNPNID